MPLAPGTRLGPYEVAAQIGVGGMGEVYRATDTNLKRAVAIKVLPEAVATDPERLARFRREAELLAALNHPNIAQIHGLEKNDGVTALVMELVEGPTLADRIARGALPVSEALPIAKQIAEALEAAHEQGIVHRDLKPANIKVREDGTVKVLDFGLAKAMDPGGMSASVSVSMSPTITTPAMTQMGMILGTAAYMSPEQARGKPVDKRADIWAFGCVLFESLTGRRVFEGEDVSLTLAEVMKTEPDWASLPALPPAVEICLRRSLKKDPKQRLRDIGEMRLALDGAFEVAASSAPTSSDGPSGWRFSRVAWLAGGAFVVGAGVAGVAVRTEFQPAVVPAVSRFEIASPADLPLVTTTRGGVNIAVSPDGTLIVYTTTSNRRPMLAVRRLADATARPIPGTEDASQPFLSPDGTQLGFVVGDKLRRMPIGGGPTVTICDMPGGTTNAGASWGEGDRIAFHANAAGGSGLYLVAAAGGRPEQITTAAEGQVHRWPQWLPGGRAIVYTVLGSGAAVAVGNLGQSSLVARSLETGQESVIVPGGIDGRYVRSGHLVYGTADGLLMAVPFDPVRMTVTGAAVPMLDGVEVKGGGVVEASAADNGLLVYAAGNVQSATRRLVWVTADGRQTNATAQDVLLDFARYPALSPDGRSAAVTVGPSSGGEIWVYELASGTPPRRLTFRGHNVTAAWMPDGRRILFSTRDAVGSNAYRLQLLQADGAQLEPSVLLAEAGNLVTVDPGGTTALFQREGRSSDLWIAQLTGEPNAHPWLQTEFRESLPAISPDGRWVAYSSNPTGRFEVYVRSFPDAGAPKRISFEGGVYPVWSRDGKAVFFQGGSLPLKLMSAAVAASGADISFATPVMLFEDNTLVDDRFAVAPDGRFLMVQNANAGTDAAAPSMTLVLNWFEELKRLAPAK